MVVVVVVVRGGVGESVCRCVCVCLSAFDVVFFILDIIISRLVCFIV